MSSSGRGSRVGLECLTEGRFEGLVYTVRTMPMTILGNTLCELWGDYQEGKLGVLYESWGINPPRV